MFLAPMKWHYSVSDCEKGRAKQAESFEWRHHITLQTHDTVYMQQIPEILT